MFGKRYLIILVGLAILIGIGLLPGPLVPEGVTSVAVALVSVLPVFWWESRQRYLEAEEKVGETYAALAEEMNFDIGTLQDPRFMVDGVPAVALQTSTWQGVLATGRIAVLDPADRKELHLLYRDVNSVNQSVGMYLKLVATPPRQYIPDKDEVGPDDIRTFPDPKMLLTLREGIATQGNAIGDRGKTILDRWRRGGLVTKT